MALDAAGGGRFLKTLLCLHDDGGLVVVKVRLNLSHIVNLPLQQAIMVMI